jgi:hypothetical protein
MGYEPMLAFENSVKKFGGIFSPSERILTLKEDIYFMN